jgi:protease-4
LAQGRVWTVNQALEVGLVDYIGGMEDAVEKAGELAGLKEFYTQAYPEQKDFFEKLSGMLTTKSEMTEILNTPGMKPVREFYQSARHMSSSNEHLYYRIPYEITIQ